MMDKPVLTIEDVISVRMYADTQGGGYQVGYRGYYARAKTLDAAMVNLKGQLDAAGIVLPRYEEESPGAVRVVISRSPDSSIPWAAEYMPYVAWGATDDVAVDLVKALIKVSGEPAPARVYNIAKNLNVWMN